MPYILVYYLQASPIPGLFVVCIPQFHRTLSVFSANSGKVAQSISIFRQSRIIQAGCEKDKDEDQISSDFKFKATVLSMGLDCGDTFTISLENLDSDSDIEDGIYYADNLPAEYKEEGVLIYLNCREPNEEEVYACTTLGPSYPHIIVTNSLLVE
jgi:hypothetical protein